MCGPTAEEKQIAGQNQAYATTVQNNYKTLFGEQQGVMDKLDNAYSPIVEAGPNQTGMSASELAARNTQAINTTGANYANAARAIGGQLAGRTTSAGEVGPTQVLKAQIASNAAGTLSNEQNQITQENYALGRQQFNQAAGGLEALNNSYGSTAAGTSGTSAGSAAFGDAKEIAAQKAQGLQAIGGLVRTGLGAFTGGLSNLDMTGNSTKGEQFQNFFEGLNA